MGGKLIVNILAFLAALCLTVLPFSVSAEIYTSTISGRDGASGFVKPSDTISISTQSILPVSVDFIQTGNYTPMNCDTSNPVKCTYSRQFNNITGSMQVVLRESGSLITKVLPVYVDLNPPSIQNLRFTSVGNGVNANFEITDTSSIAGKCAGVMKVELLLNNRLVSTVNFTSGQCSISGNIFGSIANFNGEATTSIAAYDYMGYKINRSGSPVIFESIPPKISTQVSVFKAGTDEKITSLPRGALINVDIVMSVTESELASAQADFNQLNANPELIEAQCQESQTLNNTQECKFSNIPINIQGTTQRAVFYATDFSGNKANASIALPITLSVPRFSVTVQAQSSGDSNITKIPGPNSTRTINTDLVFVARYDSPLSLRRVIVETSQISVGSEITQIQSIANLSQFNGTAFIEATECVSDGNRTLTCILKQVPVRARVQVPRLKVYGIDEAGIVSSQEVSPLWTVISSAGKVNSILPEAEKCISGICYLNPTAQKVSAVISTASSFNESGIKINGVQAACVQNSAIWVCNATIQGSTTLSLQGIDDFGNPISGQSTAKIVLDGAKPTLTSPILTSPECPTISDSLIISVNASDGGGSPSVIISTDPSQISTLNATQAKAACTSLVQGSYGCSLKIGGMKGEAAITTLNVIVSDLAGNSVSNEVQVSTCSVLNEAPNAIKSIAPAGTIPKIDRKVASKIKSLKVPVGLQGTMNIPDAVILERGRISCTSRDGVGDAYLMNENSISPVLVLSLGYQSSWAELERLSVNCTQEFKMRIGNTIYSIPEKEQMTFSLELFNNPLGTLDEAYNAKLGTIKQQIRDTDKSIGRWQKVDNTVGRLCDIATKISRINQVVQNIKVVTWTAMTAMKSLGIPGMDLLWDKIGGAMNSFHRMVSTNIWPQGWFKNGENNYGLIIKYSCSVYTCKYYDMQTYMSIGLEYLAERRESSTNQKRVVDQYEGTYYEGESDDGALGERYTVTQYSDGTTTVRFHNQPELHYSQEDVINLVYSTTARPEHFDYEIIEDVHSEGEVIVSFRQRPLLKSRPNLNWVPLRGTVSSNSPESQAFGNRVSNRITTGVGSIFSRFGNRQGQSSQPSDPAVAENERFDARLNTALDAFTEDSSTWIYNPYKSEHYDNLCIPAILYNNQKKRQLLCKQLGCIQEMSKHGGPIEACDFDYELASCMYVESARHKLEADNSMFSNIASTAWHTAVSNVAGVGIAYTYMYIAPGCAEYQSKLGGPSLGSLDGGLMSASSIKSLACGTIGSMMSVREIQSTFSGEFSRDNSPTSIPGPDFCQGVNYNE